MIRNLAFTGLLLAAAVVEAPASSQTPRERQTIREIVVYGSDPCPRGSETEVVVCARRPESERYRIPPSLREPAPSPESESWTTRAERLETVGKTGIQSCSTIGPGGATGCLEQLIKQAREERRAAEAEQRKAP